MTNDSTATRWDFVVESLLHCGDELGLRLGNSGSKIRAPHGARKLAVPEARLVLQRNVVLAPPSRRRMGRAGDGALS